MAENKLPKGVGSKIVQALKKQAEIEIQAVSDTAEEETSLLLETPVSTSDFESEIIDNISLEDNFSDFAGNEGLFEENDSIQITDFDNNELMQDIEMNSNNNFEDNFSNELNFDENEFVREQAKPQMAQQKSYSMPANVAVLKRLILQLPQGVTKQTGAQIIRQTMEALGISMNSVLKEAQQGQDSLTTSAKSCMSTIAEYKNNILSLEKQVQDYKKQAIALNDLISLFVMTDKH